MLYDFKIFVESTTILPNRKIHFHCVINCLLFIGKKSQRNKFPCIETVVYEKHFMFFMEVIKQHNSEPNNIHKQKFFNFLQWGYKYSFMKIWDVFKWSIWEGYKNREAVINSGLDWEVTTFRHLYTFSFKPKLSLVWSLKSNLVGRWRYTFS